MTLKWKTPEGLIATIDEGGVIPETYIELNERNSNIKTEIISGSLPKGINMTHVTDESKYTESDGEKYLFSGTAEELEETKHYYFTVRATLNDEQTERYFDILVQNKIAHFVGPEPEIIEKTEREYLKYQIETEFLNENDQIVKIQGTIPTGIKITNSGIIYGSLPEVENDETYPFVCGIKRDDEIIAQKQFKLIVKSVKIDSLPVWATEKGDIGPISQNQESSLFVKAYDPNDPSKILSYRLVDNTTLPNELILEEKTGYIKGVLVSSLSTTWEFVVGVSNEYGEIKRNFSIDMNSFRRDYNIEFISDTDFLTAKIGDSVSTEIVTKSKYPVTFKIISGELPSGLTFKNGLIFGNIDYQEYKTYTFTVEASNMYAVVDKEFKITIGKGLGQNALKCFLYINHEYDDEYTELLSYYDKTYAYNSYNSKYSVPSRPMVDICMCKCFDKTLMKNLLNYNKPLHFKWGTSKVITVKNDNDEELYQAFYKSIDEHLTEDERIIEE